MNKFNIDHPIKDKAQLLKFQILSLAVFAIYFALEKFVIPEFVSSLIIFHILPTILIGILIILGLINVRKIVLRPKDILYIVVPFFLIITFTIVSSMITGETSSANGDDLEELSTLINPISFLLLTCIWTPLTEELLFRKLLMGNVFYKHTIIGICISSLGFGALHMLSGFTLESFISYTLSGVVFGCVYYFSKRIELSIFAHMFNNSVLMLFVTFMPK